MKEEIVKIILDNNPELLARIATYAAVEFKKIPLEKLKCFVGGAEIAKDPKVGYGFKFCVDDGEKVDYIYVECCGLDSLESGMYIEDATEAVYKIMDCHSWEQDLKHKRTWAALYVCQLQENCKEVILEEPYVNFCIDQVFSEEQETCADIYYVSFLCLKEGEKIPEDILCFKELVSKLKDHCY